MYPAKFDYHRPSSVQEAVQLLQANPDAKILAGGHSLLPAMKLRLAQPAALIDIGRIDGLVGISQTNSSVRIGALTTHAEIAASDVVKTHCQALAEAAGWVGDRQVRHRGTIGGNLVHADPASDLPGAVLALDAALHVSGPSGERQIATGDFFIDLLTTSLELEEVLTAIEIPAAGGQAGSAYIKYEHPASGYAVCGAAALVQLDGQTCVSARLAFNGVTPTPYMAAAVSNALVGQSIDDDTIDSAVDEHLQIDDPMDDIFASETYRAQLAKVAGKAALKQARDRAA